MKIAVFSNSSFSTSHVRVGLQIMAQLLAKRGHHVDYIAVPTHPLDCLSQLRRTNFTQAWIRGRDKTPVVVSERLREFFLRTLFSRSRKCWWSERQISLYTILAPEWMKKRAYDVCIRDTAMSGLFADKVQCRAHVLRLNDHPDGLTNYIHPMIVDKLRRQIREAFYGEIWTTTATMTAYVNSIGSDRPIMQIPNGVLLEQYETPKTPQRRPKSAVYVGTFNDWVDIDLLCQAADRLRDWHIELFGPYTRKLRRLDDTNNVVYRGPIAFDNVPKLLSSYRVGLIPFSGHKQLLEAVDPLKANEYLAAGLGIASTPHGNLGTSLRNLARFGDDPISFAAAVRTADRDCGDSTQWLAVKTHLEHVSWNTIVDKIEARLERLAR